MELRRLQEAQCRLTAFNAHVPLRLLKNQIKGV
jgi:hypothetical protein